MKTPEYHNPQNVDPSNLKPGERFLLREELGHPKLKFNCSCWLTKENKWSNTICVGDVSLHTYKTTLPLPTKYRDEEIDWKSPEKQTEVRRMWAENPAMEREVWLDTSSRWTSEPEWLQANSWVTSCFYRPAQKPREKSQSDKDKEAAENHYCFTRNHGSQQIDIEVAFLAGVNYAREASRKGVA